MTYICILPLIIDKYDDDGFNTGKHLTINKGIKFQASENKSRMVGRGDTIRLDSSKQWLEIMPDTLEKHFKLVEEATNADNGTD